MFMNQPRLNGVRAMCRTTGTMIAIMRTAAISSITMNRVIWKPPIWGRSNGHTRNAGGEPRDLEGGVVDDVVQGVRGVFSHDDLTIARC